MPIGLILQIITAALELGPLAASTVTQIKQLISRDAAVPKDLSQILFDTSVDNAATNAAVSAWLAAHPKV